MSDLFDLCRAAATAAAALEPATVALPEVRTTALGLQQHIDQMNITLARVLADAEARGAWHGTGARSMADWLAGKSKSSYGQAKRKQKLGEAMGKSRDLDEAVKNGELSPDAANELTEAVSTAPEGADIGELVGAAKGATPPEAKAAAEKWKQLNNSGESEQAATRRRFEARSVKSSLPNDGMVTTTVVLPLLENRIVRNALDNIKQQSEADGRTNEQQTADALIALADAFAKGTVNGGREKPSIIVTIPVESMLGTGNEPGVTAHGDRIPAHIVRHMAHNALLQRMLNADGIILDLGREVRYATVAQYKAILARDRCCTIDTCNIPGGWCDVDHLVPWEAGGETNVDDMRLLCRFHHTMRHMPGVRVSGTALHGYIHLANGTTLHCSPKGTRVKPRTQAAA